VTRALNQHVESEKSVLTRWSDYFSLFHNSYGKSHSLITDIEGRDKLTKILQFLAKFLAWHAKRDGDSPNIEKFT
jgi:Peroxisomal biogenesis factor 11 (PEX11)